MVVSRDAPVRGYKAFLREMNLPELAPTRAGEYARTVLRRQARIHPAPQHAAFVATAPAVIRVYWLPGLESNQRPTD
jgi:hypothetical protein